eukprot:TRINITY_DN1407_c0_g1_i1.p1 TRINITY_DN1407_c0_g1~~TRINITY_DN1407_c0_g1_i1.p1  ORF type:complete len:240 (-),score=44.69 TRINITY_DN1407_c0_g1_i1:344-1063(-)
MARRSGKTKVKGSKPFALALPLGDVLELCKYGREFPSIDSYSDYASSASASAFASASVSLKSRSRRRASEKNNKSISKQKNVGAEEKEAYLRRNIDESWVPPSTSIRLLQQSFHRDPWKVLLTCILLNKTQGIQAEEVVEELFGKYPDAESMANANVEDIRAIIASLGLQNQRASTLQRFSQDYLRDDWTSVTQLHGIGKYAADAFAIFCTGRWEEVEPEDHKLVAYWLELWNKKMNPL